MKYLILAEDEPIVREYLAELFDLYGAKEDCELIVCCNGSEAITAIRAKAGNRVFLFTDLNMPIAYGDEVIKETLGIVERVVISSATLSQQILEELQKLTTIRSCPKPATPTEVKKALEFLLLTPTSS